MEIESFFIDILRRFLELLRECIEKSKNSRHFDFYTLMTKVV